MIQDRFRCVVVDDEPLARELMMSHIHQVTELTLVGCYASAIEARQYLVGNLVDLIFLDVEMPVLRGTDFYQNLDSRPEVIFTTAYRDFAVEGFELEAVDYLLKPIAFPRFLKAVDRFLVRQVSTVETPKDNVEACSTSIIVRSERRDVRLKTADILWVAGLRDYLKIHCREGVFIVKETFGNIEKQLGPGFVRVHRSYIVNGDHVSAVSRDEVELNQNKVPIGASYRQSAMVSLGFNEDKTP